MELGRFLRSFVDNEAMGDEVLATIEGMYRRAVKMHPGAEPHAILADIWIARMRANGMARNIDPGALPRKATEETELAACLPPPLNSRALALFMLLKERPDIAAECPKFREEFGALMSPLLDPNRDAINVALYQRHNPNSAWHFASLEELRRTHGGSGVSSSGPS